MSQLRGINKMCTNRNEIVYLCINIAKKNVKLWWGHKQNKILSVAVYVLLCEKRHLHSKIHLHLRSILYYAEDNIIM